MNVSEKRVGLIGLGLLGGALADRLLGQGWQVVGYDVDVACRRRFEQAGGRSTAGPQEVMGTTDTVLLSLPTSQVVAEVIEKSMTATRSGQTIIDTTTGDPQQMAEMGQLLRSRGVRYLEANVAGSSDQARRGEAVLLLGGDPDAILASASVLEAIGQQRFRLGDVGCGSRFKLVHNLILGLHRAVLAEGLRFAEALGFDPGMSLGALQQTPAASAVMETKGPKMIVGDYAPQARLSQHLKDVELMLLEASRARIELPLTKVHRSLLDRAERLGFGDADNSAIIEAFRSDGVEVD